MRLYVAGKWYDRVSIGRRIRELQTAGHEITYDWTRIDENPALVGRGEIKYGEESVAVDLALLEINAVKSAHAVVAIMDDEKYPYRGTFCEIGCALALSKKVLVYMPNLNSYCNEVCFLHHPLIEKYRTWNELIARLS